CCYRLRSSQRPGSSLPILAPPDKKSPAKGGRWWECPRDQKRGGAPRAVPRKANRKPFAPRGFQERSRQSTPARECQTCFRTVGWPGSQRSWQVALRQPSKVPAPGIAIAEEESLMGEIIAAKFAGWGDASPVN